MKEELPYWLALAHLPKITNRQKNEILVKLFEEKSSIIDFFHWGEAEWKSKFGFAEKDIFLLKKAVDEVSNYAFMVEDLLNQGYNIIPITSADYSHNMKKNLGRSYAPPLIYIKGNKEILKEKSVAIVGSRKSNDISLDFTDKIAKIASTEFKVVVSGFAKGVDKQALDSALKYKGQSIIVLPQGITTFSSGYKKYYSQIVKGDVLVLSTFFPKAPWSVQLAMARNPIIYGLASEIYVAESDNKGGTWSGVIDGLRKNRKIYVREPDIGEKNANNLLIQKGAIPVDIDGNVIHNYEVAIIDSDIISEPPPEQIESSIIELLKKGRYSSKKIIEILKIGWSTRKMTNFLKAQDDVISIKSKIMEFTHKTCNQQGALF